MNFKSLVAFGCALFFVSACGGSDEGSSTETNDAPTTVSASTDASAVLTADDMETDWLVVRQMTVDDGYWLLPAGTPVVEYRRFSFTCVDPSCTELSATFGFGDGSTFDDPLGFTFDGTTMITHDVVQRPCLNAAGTAWDGPEERADTLDISMTPLFDDDGVLVSFVGDYELRSVSAASANCSAENVGYQADVLMFREDRATKIPLSDGVYAGEGAVQLSARGIHGCVEGACKLREPGTVATSTGRTEVTWEWALTETEQGQFAGELTYVDSCFLQTNVFVADGVYLVTLSVVVEQLQVTGSSEPVLFATTTVHGVQNPDSGVSPEFLQLCQPFDLEYTYAGLPSAMTDLIDFTATPITALTDLTPITTLTADDMGTDWIEVRQVTVDDDFWQRPAGHDPAVDYRRYSFTCVDPSCTELSATVGLGNGSTVDHPLGFTFDGTTMIAQDVVQQPCLNAAGTAWDGPLERTDTVEYSMTPLSDDDGVLVSFVGDYEQRTVSAASANCSAADIGYRADVLMFREDRATKIPLSDGVYFGEGEAQLSARGIHGCAEGACKLREHGGTITSAGVTDVTWEWALTETEQGQFAGEFTYLEGCRHNETGEFVAEGVYLVTLSVVVEQLQVTGSSPPVLFATTAVHGVQNPDSGVSPEFLQFCPPFDLEWSFAGLPSTMTDLIDFTATPIATVG